jgi:YbbR domain-containing protein
MMAYHPFSHLGLKLLAVAVAVGLWLAVAGEQTVERSLRVPLELQDMPERLELVDNPPTTVEVRVRGASGLLSHLATGDIVAVIDLTAARAGRRFFHLTREQVRSPFGVDVVQVSPTTVPLNFEAQATRVVPVVPVVEGTPAPGYVRGAITVEPPSVEVTGPETALGRLKEAQTEPVSVAGARQRVREDVTIGVPDPSLRLKPPANATVTVVVDPSPVERLVEHVPVRMRGVGRGLSAQVVPAAVGITTRGTKDTVDALQADSITAFVDLAGLGPGQYNLPVRLEPPKDFVALRTEPSTVRVRIK